MRELRELVNIDRTVVFNNIITPYTNKLYNSFFQSGFDIIVISCSRQEANRSWADSIDNHYTHRVLPGLTLRLSDARFAHINFGIWKTLCELKPNRLIINGFFPSMLLATIWAVVHKVPLALTTDGWAHTMPNSLYHRLVRPFILKHCKAVACCGAKGAAYMASQGISEARIFTVPLAPAWGPPNSIPSFSERSYDLLWCAQMNDAVKNVSFFVDVVIELRKLKPSLKVRLVGTGPAENRILILLRSLGIDFRHDSYLPWYEMADVFTSAKLLLLPSLWEPWGLVCNEAMQCGTPAIVSPYVGAADDLIHSHKNGFVEPFNISNWVSRCAKLVESAADWQEFSNAAIASSIKDPGLEVEKFKAFVSAVAPPKLGTDFNNVNKN